jgi:oligoendopeptidase F
MEIMEKERGEIQEKYKWDLSIMYKDDMEWEADFDKVSRDIVSFTQLSGTLGKSAEGLLTVLRKKDEISRVYEKLSSYAMRKNDEDTRCTEGTRLKNKIISLGAEFSEAAAFFEPELMSISDEQIKSFLDKNQDLITYKQYLDNILRFREHTLSIGEEKILASASEILTVPSKTYTVLNNADIKFGKIKDEDGNTVELSKRNYSKYISSQDREVEKNHF